MIYSAILIASAFLLGAFAIERACRPLGLPSVIVMILVGMAVKPFLSSFGYGFNDLETVVPILGTVGLVLIVLEGALDIELLKERLKTMVGAIGIAIAGFAACTLLIAVAASWWFGYTPFQAMVIAVPLAVISSAVAIPSSQFLPPESREFVVYESSLSDILGVLFFFALINSDGQPASILASFVGGGALSLVLSILFALALTAVLVRIDGHIRFIPLLAALFGLYALGKLLHLSPLIMVLLFGLALNNPTLLKRLPGMRHWLDESYDETLRSFKGLVCELTFAVRGFFFILLGYWTNLAELLAPEAWIAALLVLAVVYLSRHAMLRLIQHKHANSLTWLAPRGLITILLFLHAKEILPVVPHLNGAVVLVILISSSLITLSKVQMLRSAPIATPPSP